MAFGGRLATVDGEFIALCRHCGEDGWQRVKSSRAERSRRAHAHVPDIMPSH